MLLHFLFVVLDVFIGIIRLLLLLLLLLPPYRAPASRRSHRPSRPLMSPLMSQPLFGVYGDAQLRERATALLQQANTSAAEHEQASAWGAGPKMAEAPARGRAEIRWRL